MKVLLSFTALSLAAHLSFADTNTCKAFYTGAPAPVVRPAKPESSQFSAETLHRLRAYVKTLSDPTAIPGIPESIISSIEHLRTTEMPYENQVHAIVEKLGELKLGINKESLAEKLLSFENRDQSTRSLIEQAVRDSHSASVSFAQKLSRTTEAEIESVRKSEILYESAFAQIEEKLDRSGIPRANEVSFDILDSVNKLRTVREVIEGFFGEKPKTTSPKLTKALQLEIEDLRVTSLPFQALFSRIKQKLESAGIENAKEITTELLKYENLSKPVLEFIEKPSATKSNVINLPRTEDLANLVLQTERLEIRAIGRDKLQDAMLAWGDPKTATMSGDQISQETGAYLLSIGRVKLAEVKDTLRPYINFGIYMDGKLVGMSQVAAGQEDTIYRYNLGTHSEKWVSISYHLTSNAWGKGIATETATRLVKFAFETLNVTGIHAEVISTNPASENVLKKIGFENFQNFPGQPHGTRHFYMNRALFSGSIQKASGL